LKEEKTMIDTSVNLQTKKPLERCHECDTETDHYNIFITPDNERNVICAECLERAEKGFNTVPGYGKRDGFDKIPIV
jgi:hypothetical protein